MSGEQWRYIFASVAGASHEKNDLPCQDVSACRVLADADGAPVLVAVVADGAGSAPHSDVGASLACSLITSKATHFLQQSNLRGLTRDIIAEWLRAFRLQVRARAAARSLTARDFACTALAAIVGEERAAFLQIGDGAIVVSRRDEPDEYAWVFWPQQGEYANTTYFATDGAASERLAFEVVDGRVDEAVLFTDGLQLLALHYESRTAFAPFFRPFFAALRPAAAGHSARLSEALAGFLRSPRVTARTDDDKTLVVATRRPAALLPAPAPAADSDACAPSGVSDDGTV